MSAFLDRAELLCSYLARVVGLESLEFVVDRQKDIAHLMEVSLAKKEGLALIAWLGGKNEREAKIPRVNSRFTITVFCKPVLREGEESMDDMLELIAAAVQHWSPDPTKPDANRTRFEVTDIDPVLSDAEFFVMQIKAESIIQFPKRTILLNS